ncbi:MAG: methylmalonyl Co-A mutase-associated GTPase MeaB [Saprospiraceae bacterium]
MEKKKKPSKSSSKGINPRLKQTFQRKVQMGVGEYIRGLQAGDRSTLAQAITLIESNRPEQMEMAQELLKVLRKEKKDTFRIGITGSPGVGKSTFIEALGMSFINQGHKVAVLSIDPSSNITKGSILGDKTRMTTLSANSNAFIRPSPSAGTLGGVARNTRETIELCEAAGYDRILIETVGVGQSETNVYYLADFFLLLLLPGAGDDLQGIKRGIVEMADLLIINKADGDRKKLAKEAKRNYQTALHLFPMKANGWQPKVKTCSALEGDGIPEIKTLLENYKSQTDLVKAKRNQQNKYWMYEAIDNGLKNTFFNHQKVRGLLSKLENDIEKESLSPFEAAEKLLQQFFSTEK